MKCYSAGFRIAVVSALSLCALYYAHSQAASTPQDDRGASLLPDGAGKQLVVAKCLICHGAKMIMSQRGTQEDWNETLDKMIANGATVSDDEADKIVSYLTAHFGPSTGAAPTGGPQAAPSPAPSSSSTAP